MVAMVVIKCPETDREIPTGIVTDLARVHRLVGRDAGGLLAFAHQRGSDSRGRGPLRPANDNNRHFWNGAFVRRRPAEMMAGLSVSRLDATERCRSPILSGCPD